MKKNLLLLTILIAGFALRLLSAHFHSYSSDELSAIIRLNYTSFQDLIELGVKTGDMHPAGVQVFMKFWSNLFGLSEFAMRLPFVILGVLSVFLVYQLGNFYSKKVALFSAAFWSLSLFPIIQSELARPYSPGLFFILLSALYIVKILFKPLSKKQTWLNASVLALSVSACMYTHYFAFLSVAFMAFTGLVFIKKQVFLPYVLAGVMAVLLFIPHLEITLYQISIEGGIQWLSPPGKYWLFQFLFHAFNSSWFLITAFVIGIIFSAQHYIIDRNFEISKKTILFCTWFFGIYILGTAMSLYFTPIMKFPVMIFVFPFFVIILAKFLAPTFNKLSGLMPLIIISCTFISTTYEKRLFDNVHYEVFKELIQHIRIWGQAFNLDNSTKVMNVSNPEYLNFYARQTGSALDYDLDVLNYGDAQILDSVLQHSTSNHLILGFSGRHTPVQFFNQSLIYFPYIIDGYQYNNSSVYLLSKNVSDQGKNLNIERSISFNDQREDWMFERDKSTQSYLTDRTNPYRPQYILPVSKKMTANRQYIRVVLSASIDETDKVTIVAVPETSSGEPVQDNYGNPIWLGLDAEQSLAQNASASFAFSVPHTMPTDGFMKIYIWNRSNTAFLIKNVEIQLINNIWNN